MVVWYIFPSFGILYLGKICHPVLEPILRLLNLQLQRQQTFPQPRKSVLKTGLRRRGAMDIASASGTECPGSNPAGG
jgi:hypothetical protein